MLKFLTKLTNSLRTFFAVAITVCFILCAGSSNAYAIPSHAIPKLKLSKELGGQAAINELGANITSLGRAYGMSGRKLKELLLEDTTLRVHRRGRLFYMDRPLPSKRKDASGAMIVSASSIIATADIPLQNAFLLHSRPAAKKTIYLDFDGMTLSGTAWNAGYNAGNPIVAPAWDIDGSPTTFGNSERSSIIKIWQRVAEDYATFDVDVTTEFLGEDRLTRASSSDEYYGIRVLISPISNYMGNYGGYAYLGVFDDIGDYYKPALVFPEKLANGEKYIAEACSHESGHTLGLSHDGTTTGTSYYAGHGSGETGWAPIMGNSYYQNLSQWSKGEYPNANNSQDDLTIIKSYVGSFSDDHGNTMGSATALPNGSSINTYGIIDSNTDADFYRFMSGSGTISLVITPNDIGPDLDIKATLYDSGGNALLSANADMLLNASFATSVEGGTYFLEIKGVGKGDLSTGYSNYASRGKYAITGTIVPYVGTVAPVAIISASTTSGIAPLSIQFGGNSSYDMDGSIVSYSWDFGDGIQASGSSVSHTFITPGSYQVKLTVVDNDGQSTSSNATISVLSPNILPVAGIAVNSASGQAPLNVSFSGASSTDTDGSVVSYSWNFGDGSTATGVSVQHTYATVGNFTAVLTVTDNRGGIGTASISVSVQPSPSVTMMVSNITLTSKSSSAGTSIEARATITNLLGTVVSGATVTGTFSGTVSGNVSAVTNSTGVATFNSRRFKKSGPVYFTITSVSKSGMVYDASKNIITSKGT